MPKILKKKPEKEDQLETSNVVSYALLTLVYYLKVTFKSNLWIKFLVVSIILIFMMRRYFYSKETETIDGIEVPMGSDQYDLNID